MKIYVLPAALLLFASACTKPEQPTAAEQPAAARQPATEAHDHAGEPAAKDALVPPPVATGTAQNPLQAEMRALTSLMQVAVVAVANDQLQLIPPAIQQLHGAMETTQAALEAGEFKLPYNADDVEGFIATDDAFHDELVGLVRAARADDGAAVAQQLGKLFEGCVSCHARYRFPPAEQLPRSPTR